MKFVSVVVSIALFALAQTSSALPDPEGDAPVSASAPVPPFGFGAFGFGFGSRRAGVLGSFGTFRKRSADFPNENGKNTIVSFLLY